MRFTPSKTSRRVASAAVAIAASAMLLAGCAAPTGGDSGGDSAGAGSITVIPKSLGNKYFEARQGCQGGSGRDRFRLHRSRPHGDRFG